MEDSGQSLRMEAMKAQSRLVERAAREKRCLDSASAEETQSDRKRPALASVIVEALKVDSLQKLCSSLEPILRRVVSEEVERALAKLGGPAKLTASRACPKRLEGAEGRNLQLQFRSRLSLPLFTGGKVEGDQGSAIHVVLIDGGTGQFVTSGPESCARLDVVVLEGDFNDEDDSVWSAEDFDGHLVREREGKRPLLTGDLQVVLKEGAGNLGEFTFTDNSSWIRSRKFRLGLKVSPGSCDGIRIREAKTEAFTVKDHRGELYKKHYPPALTDEVWRLEKIGKDGSFHKRLNKAGIYTVEDFLRLVVRDSQRLRNILGSGMSNKMWDALVDHAKTCVLGGKLYVYYTEDDRSVAVAFNNIYEFSGLIANGQFCSPESLPESQKVYVDTLVRKAYDNWMDVIEYDGKSVINSEPEKISCDAQLSVPISSQDYSNLFQQQFELPALPLPLHQDHQPGPSNSGNSGPGYDHHDLSARLFANLNPPHRFEGLPSFSLQQNQIPSENADLLGSFRGVEDYFHEEEIRARSHDMLQNEDMQHLLRLFDMGGGGHVSNDGYAPENASMGFNGLEDDRSRSGKAVVGWLKLKAALRWGIFVRKRAAERRAQLVELDDS